MWSSHTMEYYSAIKRNVVWYMLQHGWTSNIMLSERNYSQNINNSIIPFIWNVQNRKSIVTESRLVVAQGWDGKEGEGNGE